MSLSTPPRRGTPLRRRAAAVTVAVVVGLAAPAGASSHHPPRPTPPPKPTHKLLLQGPITFWECSKKTTQALIGVNTLTLHPGDTLHVNFIVRNESTSPCNYVAPVTLPGAPPPSLGMGPCGAVGFEILGAHNRNVWPGTKPFNCPALTFAQLGVNATTAGSGTWDQSTASGRGRIAPGTYTLLVDDHFLFALVIKKT